jgi:6,7-dimethyl-8-ribityllumazine synthase
VDRFALIVSRFNEEITSGLLAGARDALAQAGVRPEDVEVFHVPGAFEIPFAAKRAAASGQFAAVVCLGCLIKGETMHFEYIAEAVAHGIMHVGLDTGVPVTFGVLTTLTDAQAEARAATGPGNKGAEAAQAAIDMVRVARQLRSHRDLRV